MIRWASLFGLVGVALLTTILVYEGIGPVTASGRRLYAQLEGGVSANDYRLTWSGQDSLGNLWIRTCLLLCAATS